MSTEPESLILRMLRDMRAEMATKSDIAELKSDMAELKSELKSDMHSLRADVAADFIAVRKVFIAVRKEFGEQISGLRRAVIEYHASVIGHGIIISELEARMRRVEQHLNLPSLDAH